jgi:L-alanine-DL-glutamate epimerase-like enolase superfamily enzyme
VKITDYKVERTFLTPADPTWRISGFSIPKYEGTIVTLIAEDGNFGEGYGAPYTFLGETPSGCHEAIEMMCREIVGQPALGIQGVMKVVRGVIRGHEASKAAMDCALHDLAARILRTPLYNILGGKVRSRIPLMRILTLKAPREMAERAKALVDEGYKYVKVKVAGDVKEDVERVKAVRHAVGENIFVSADPNQAYQAKDAIAFCRQAEEYGVTMVEQPVAEADLEGLREVTHASGLKIEADEAATTIEQSIDLAAHRRVDGINLKISRCGGILNVMTIAHLCDAVGLGCRLGANVGSRLLTAQAVHVAAVLPNLQYASELAEFERLRDDPYEGLTIIDGEILVPDEIGSGVRRRS